MSHSIKMEVLQQSQNMQETLSKTNPIQDASLRSILDTVGFEDMTCGWRSLEAVANALSIKLCQQVTVGQLNSYLNANNIGDRIFESQLIDGEACIRSHKFDRNRESFIEALSDLRRQVQAHPHQQAQIVERSGFYIVKSLLPKHNSMTQPARLVCR